MTDFAPGDVVVCVEPNDPLKMGCIYRVIEVKPPIFEEIGLRVSGAERPWASDRQGWKASRFRKLKAADEQFTEQMRALRPVPATLSRSSENRNG